MLLGDKALVPGSLHLQILQKCCQATSWQLWPQTCIRQLKNQGVILPFCPGSFFNWFAFSLVTIGELQSVDSCVTDVDFHTAPAVHFCPLQARSGTTGAGRTRVTAFLREKKRTTVQPPPVKCAICGVWLMGRANLSLAAGRCLLSLKSAWRKIAFAITLYFTATRIQHWNWAALEFW